MRWWTKACVKVNVIFTDFSAGALHTMERVGDETAVAAAGVEVGLGKGWAGPRWM